jgi:ketosteroid isomerase-like protein
MGALAWAACAPATDESGAPAGAAGDGATAGAARIAAIEDSLMQADRDFASATAERGVDGWVSWFAADGAMVTAGGEVKGHDAIRELMASALSDSGPRLLWEPTYAEAGGGNLGYTIGTSQRVARDSAGTLLGTGNYLTVWRRQADGTWKVERDIGTYTPVVATE